MLVQLSPWETTSTTLRPSSSASRRRRKRSNSDAGPSGPSQHHDDHDDLDISACFVVSGYPVRRSRTGQKQQQQRKLLNGKQVINNIKHEEGFSPILSVTTAHRVGVVGRSRDGGFGTASSSSSSSSPLKESSLLQFASRPGSSTSFFAEEKVNGSTSKAASSVTTKSTAKASLLPRVAAYFDYRNNLVYALQNDNSVLVCWNSLLANGPDDDTKDSSAPIRIRMESPVLSMSLVPILKGVVCGTCLDGRIFVAWWRQNNIQESGKLSSSSDALQIEYFESNIPNTRTTTTAPSHKATVVVLKPNEVQKTLTSVTRQKRKLTTDVHGIDQPTQKHQLFTVCQLFGNGGANILAVIHEFSFSATGNASSLDDDNATFWDLQRSIVRSWTTCPSITAIASQSTPFQQRQGPVMAEQDSSTVLFASEINPSTLALVCHVQQQNFCSKSVVEEGDSSHCVCLQVGMDNGKWMRSPIELPKTTRNAALVSSDLLAVGTADHILLYDLRFGALVLSESLNDTIGIGQDWMLLADVKRHRLAILYQQEGYIHFGLSSAIIMDSDEGEDSYKPLTTGISLACELRSSLVSGSPDRLITRRPRTPAKYLQSTATTSAARTNSEIPHLYAIVDQSLSMLEKARNDILDPKCDKLPPTFLLGVYDQAVAQIMDHHAKKKESFVSTELSPNAPKSREVASSSKAERANGYHGPTLNTGAATVSGVKNGQYPLQRQERLPAGHTPSSCPQKFIDGAIAIILSILQLDKSYTGLVGLKVRFARFDARLIISRLIQTGKLSARQHFDKSTHTEKEDDEEHFTNILRSIKLSNKRRQRVFSPVDMMHEMLRWCPDVSERMMVTMVHYAMCRALPDDFAESILDSRLHAQHPHKLLSRRYIELRNQVAEAERLLIKTTNQHKESTASKADAQKQALVRVTSKLILAGISSLVQHIVSYSDCNESLLRAAMAEVLRDRTEIDILAKILAELLTKSARGTFGQSVAQCRENNVTLMKWISALVTSRRVELTVPIKDGSPSPIALLQHAVSDVVKQSEAILSLREILSKTESANERDRKRRRTESKEEIGGAAASAPKTMDSSEIGAVAPYTIERLVF